MGSIIHWQNLAKEGVVLRERHYADFYPTNKEHVISGLNLIPFTPDWVLDAGSGNGIWGKYARELWTDSMIVGVEMRLDAPFFNWYDWNIRADFLKMTLPDEPYFECVIGNPPYNVAEEFVRHSYDLLVDGGYMVQLLKLSFLTSERRYRLYEYDMPLKRLVVCSDRPSFTPDGKTGAESYAFFVWEKGWQGGCELDFVLSKKEYIHQFELDF